MIECLKCKNLNVFGIGCKAYPEGIPIEITDGTELHHEVRKDQKGNFVFEEEDDEEEEEEVSED